MANIRVESKAAFQAGLEQRLGKLDKNEALKQFSRHFFSEVPLTEIVRKDWEYAEGTLLSSWRFYSRFDGKRPIVRVLNPTEDKDGYEHKQTVIEVASTNVPFLLQSIRIELNNQGIVLSDVQQCMLSAVRDKGGKLVITDDENPNETLIHLEVNRLTSTASLEKRIREVIRYVQRAVHDFAPMRKQLLLLSDELGVAAQSRPGSELTEDYEFLKWLYANNFTFLASEQFVKNANGEFEFVPGSAYGLARKGFYCHGRPLDPIDDIVTVAKSPIKSRVHRPAYLDCITVKFKGEDGVERVSRYTGLFTLSVYNQSPSEIPIVRQKLKYIFENTGLEPASHKGRELHRIIEALPREELFLANTEQLDNTVSSIFSLQERRIVRVLVRRDDNGYFVNCLVFVPKDIYDTALRLKIQDLLSRKFSATDAEFSTLFSESALIRIQFVLRVDPQSSTNVDVDEIERQVSELTRSWEDDLRSVIFREMGETDGEALFEKVRNVFPPGYRDDYWPSTAYGDLEFLLALSDEEPLKVNLYEWMVFGRRETRFKLYHQGKNMPLSDVIPILENLGARTIEEHPYSLELGGQRIWIHDFVLKLNVQPEGGLGELRDNFEEAFKQIWAGGKENDGFNRLVPSALMNHREVAVIRAYARYFGQLQSSFSQAFIADCVTRYSAITRQLFELFDLRLNPTLKRESAMAKAEKQREDILASIDEVENLADDRILRRYVEMINATQRTNFYQPDPAGKPKEYISFKFLPELIPEMPLPKPKYEIFVYSPKVEGVHLRGGKVARGGLRWSDRTEDYRTEILGLVKAQQVKNSVIVPVGAKGGFLPKVIREGASRDEVMETGIACYKIFVQGLLDLTDNLVKGKVVPPDNVVRHDDDDYYLVVAADKGTASFSDIANEISERHGFWLGDAFASGGSVGYDHKAMGITAKGAWKSVQQHFRDLGIDIQKHDFTVVGIGDMAGDVFGNGMLLSEHICLVAAFNHQHIFIDPTPDPAASFAERKRLFELPRSSWADYDAGLISKGGGIFSRSAKSIPLSPEVKKLLGVSDNVMTPTRLISAILRARVDLLWNGGIGTYVKSHHESHLDVGDKANDGLRVNANELRCRVIGEGGNLGMTQLARVEFNLLGGICFTDFIDNAGGVNCSDEEVNIKILLNQLLEKGELDSAKRAQLLKDMTQQVADIVLENNYRQAQAINLMNFQSIRRGYEYSRLMHQLEDKGLLDAQLEYLPNDEELQERRTRGKAFTAPELSVLTSYVKGWLKQDLAKSKLLDEPFLMQEMDVAFPPILVEKYGDELQKHRLRREIVATQIANGMVNRMGISFISRMAESTGVDNALIAKAYIGARSIFDIDSWWDEIQLLDYKVEPSVQKEMMIDLIRLVRRTTRWLLRNRRHALNLEEEVPVFQAARTSLFEQWGELLCGTALTDWQELRKALLEAGVGEPLAGFVAAAHHMYGVLGIVEASNRTGESPQQAASIYFAVGEKLELHWFSRQIHEYQASNQWEALARESLQDDLNWQQVAITLGVIAEGKNGTAGRHVPAEGLIDRWIEEHHLLVERWMSLVSEMRAANMRDPAVFTVAIRELLDLAQSSGRARTRF